MILQSQAKHAEMKESGFFYPESSNLEISKSQVFYESEAQPAESQMQVNELYEHDEKAKGK